MLNIIGPIGLAACIVLKARPSTLLRVGEDTVLNGFKNIERGAKRFARSVRHEYRARQLVAAQEALAKDMEAIHRMTPAQRAALLRDQNEIDARAAELIASRTSKADRRAARVGRRAQVQHAQA